MKKLPLYVALDVDDKEQALFVVKQTAPYIEGFKIGPRLLLRTGTSFITKIKPYGKVFLDLKFFDIPSTMGSAVESAFNRGADMVTVHAQAGETALKLLAGLEARLNTKRPFRILAVTVLTSLQQEHLPPLAKPYSVFSHVESLSDMVMKSGLKGIVCSGHEVTPIRKRHPSAYLLIPALRPQSGWQGQDDQKRVWTPQKALTAGANALVMGRSIYQSPDPAKVCAQLLHDMKSKQDQDKYNK